MHTAKRLFAVLGLLSAFLTAGVAASNAAEAKRPNIVFIFSDDHAYQAISAYGSKLNKTPNIDRLAKEGMRFDRCLVTNSICGPSRATVLTGKYSHMNGFYNNTNSKFDGSQVTFAQAAAEGRLSDRHDRQVAPRHRSDRLRLLGNPAGPGPVLQPADDSQRQEGQARTATPPTSSPTSRWSG